MLSLTMGNVNIQLFWLQANVGSVGWTAANYMRANQWHFRATIDWLSIGWKVWKTNKDQSLKTFQAFKMQVYSKITGQVDWLRLYWKPTKGASNSHGVENVIVIFQSIVLSTLVAEDRNFCYLSSASLRNVFSYFQQLIPEFFQSSGEFLLNSQSLPLGCKQDKTKVMDVELPCWATGRTKGDQHKSISAKKCTKLSHKLVPWVPEVFFRARREKWIILIYHLACVARRFKQFLHFVFFVIAASLLS